MAKEPLRKVRDKSDKDLTKTYRPTEDWSMPLEQILEQLPPEAFEPPGTSPQQPPSNESSKPKPESGSDEGKR
ncbi:hypothetical protein [Fervidibacter sacchari]